MARGRQKRIGVGYAFIFFYGFARRHPQGLAVRAPKRRLSGSYRSASGTIQVSIDTGDLPDIAAVAAPLGGLKDLLHDCQTELEAYSRLLGRRSEAKGTLEASLLLPDDLMDSEFGKGVAELRDELSSLMGDHGPHRIDVLDLIGRLGLAPVDGKLTAAVQRQAATVLDRLDIAFEPDRRYGDVSLAPDGEMVLFRSGYSVNDPPFRYLMNAVAGDSLHFPDLRDRFVFAPIRTMRLRLEPC
ncbi:hypothetical protein D3C85_517460 [compost metagenome]